ncbi:MAG: copper amine oxidase [bacterium]
MNKMTLITLAASRWSLGASAVALLFVGMMFSQSLQARPSVPACDASHSISHSFSSGAAWSLCWEERDKEGIVLTRVRYQTPDGVSRQVLGEAALSQVVVTPDDGSTTRYSVSDAGLGGTHLLTLGAGDCPAGTLIDSNGRAALCRSTASMGYVYKYYSEQKQGQLLELSSVSQSGDLTYIVRWQFLESGDIQPVLGISGDLEHFTASGQYGWPVDAGGTVATGLSFGIYWKLDFDLAGTNGNDVVEELNSTPSADRRRKTLSKTRLRVEQALTTDIETKTFWRVYDAALNIGSQRPISYELQPLSYGQKTAGPSGTAGQSDLFITRYNACERFAVDNPPVPSCGTNLVAFTNAQNIDQKDVVLWYRQGYHLLPRDEDENKLGTHWNSFLLTPRDWNASNPLN